jgi:hypothetical protein
MTDEHLGISKLEAKVGVVSVSPRVKVVPRHHVTRPFVIGRDFKCNYSRFGIKVNKGKTATNFNLSTPRVHGCR